MIPRSQLAGDCPRSQKPLGLEPPRMLAVLLWDPSQGVKERGLGLRLEAPCQGQAEHVWPGRGWLHVSIGGMWVCMGPRPPPTPGGNQRPYHEGASQGEASWVAQAPSGSILDVPPGPSHLGPGRAVFPRGAIPRTSRAYPRGPHGLASKPLASSASGAGPEDSPTSRTRVGRRWLDRAEGARPGAMPALGNLVGTLLAYQPVAPMG